MKDTINADDNTNSSSKSIIRLFFDENSPLTETSDIEAFVLHFEGYAALQIGVPLDISAPGEKSDATLFDFTTGTTMITPRIVRIDNLLVTGRYGPVRSEKATTGSKWTQKFRKIAKCADMLNTYASSNVFPVRILSKTALDTLIVKSGLPRTEDQQERAEESDKAN